MFLAPGPREVGPEQAPTRPSGPALTLWPRAQLSAEVLILLSQPPQLQFGLLRRHLQLGSPGSQG